MSTKTDKGFINPEPTDWAALPAIIALNNENLEKQLELLQNGIDGIDRTIILFHDWDDTIIGALAVPKGKDCRAVVNEYVKNNLIHPDLRDQTTEQLASIERTDNYRGEYPHTGPDEDDPLRTGGADTVEDGGDYPLTNHLEYCFYGKDIDKDYPYINGWAIVDADNVNDTFTALSYNQTPEAAGLTMADFSDLEKFSGGGSDS